jgi:AcrR family transcriptional regulator
MSVAKRPARLTAEARRAEIEDAACRCLARGGFRDFTTDKIMAEAGVSRGLILHHFGSMEGLLVAVYTRMYGDWLAVIGGGSAGAPALPGIIDQLIGGELFDRDTSRIWIALWDLIPGHPVLHAAHRTHYETYRQVLAAALDEVALRNARSIDAPALAAAFICLIDGFGLQRGIDPELLSPARARMICRLFLEPHVGPIDAMASAGSA